MYASLENEALFHLSGYLLIIWRRDTWEWRRRDFAVLIIVKTSKSHDLFLVLNSSKIKASCCSFSSGQNSIFAHLHYQPTRVPDVITAVRFTINIDYSLSSVYCRQDIVGIQYHLSSANFKSSPCREQLTGGRGLNPHWETVDTTSNAGQQNVWRSGFKGQCLVFTVGRCSVSI